MFNKLSFEELSSFYGALTDLEIKYGRAAVKKGAEAMSDILDHEGRYKQEVNNGEQLELIPDDEPEEGDKKKKRVVKHMNKVGQNDLILKEYVKREHQEMNVDEWLCFAYYRLGITQREIGELAGVNQRHISQRLKKISEMRKRLILEKVAHHE